MTGSTGHPCLRKATDAQTFNTTEFTLRDRDECGVHQSTWVQFCTVGKHIKGCREMYLSLTHTRTHVIS